MKRLVYILPFLAAPLFAQESTSDAVAAQDSATVDRTVYVEREFQPTVQSAGKIAVKPEVYEPQIVPQTPVYSSFSSPLSMDYNVRQLDFSTLNFRHPEALHGFMKAGVGHQNTLFSFNYRVTDSQMHKGKKQKNSANDLVLDLHADHLAQWGLKTYSASDLGFDFSKQLPKAQIFFGASGGNDYFTRYGKYFTPNTSDPGTGTYSKNRLKDVPTADRQSIWLVNTRIGVRSLPDADISYSVQTGYESFLATNCAIEHQIHTCGSFEWGSNFHHIGAEADIQNRFYSNQSSGLKTRTNHRIHIEPYYFYDGNRIRLHAGANLDFSAGRGRIAGISPNIRFEADLTQNWLALYADVTGGYEANGAKGEYRENIYRAIECLFEDSISGTYVPVNAELGFKIRPYETLLLTLHAGYMYMLDQHVNVFGKEIYGEFEHESQNSTSWKIGGDIHYHWRDIVNVNVGGNYYIYKALTDIGNLTFDDGRLMGFDGPDWDLHARVDVNINRKWSVYSDNYLLGKRTVCVFDLTTGSYDGRTLRPAFDLNLGMQYNVNRWLSVFAQLNNYLAWTEKLSYYTFYGHEAARANCMLGLTWSF